MLTGWLALASVHLCLVCQLPAVLPGPNLCSHDLHTNVQTLISSSDVTLLDSKLYTPTIDDYKKCPRSTMKCFAEEMKVLIVEWETIPYKGINLSHRLNKLVKKLNQVRRKETRSVIIVNSSGRKMQKSSSEVFRMQFRR
ncbi:hypothetical protein GBF38_002672 [Nibea albiflora]|uniref:Uncharacterized protein n=1 Tax=Nibea albiflora TaxID=240163 RepID=A0ACB7ELH0_NIBAL|nr:hypothetical protein GBF38_002672 [Nibea albiflora]